MLGQRDRTPGDVGRRGLRNLFPCLFCGLARGQRLGRDGLHASALQYSPREARKTASADPKCLTSLRDFVGPRPGGSEMASYFRESLREKQQRSTKCTPSELQFD
jgi:hypothetical protein